MDVLWDGSKKGLLPSYNVPNKIDSICRIQQSITFFVVNHETTNIADMTTIPIEEKNGNGEPSTNLILPKVSTVNINDSAKPNTILFI